MVATLTPVGSQMVTRHRHHVILLSTLSVVSAERCLSNIQNLIQRKKLGKG
jgi:hypothetical protein